MHIVDEILLKIFLLKYETPLLPLFFSKFRLYIYCDYIQK